MFFMLFRKKILTGIIAGTTIGVAIWFIASSLKDKLDSILTPELWWVPVFIGILLMGLVWVKFKRFP